MTIASIESGSCFRTSLHWAVASLAFPPASRASAKPIRACASVGARRMASRHSAMARSCWPARASAAAKLMMILPVARVVMDRLFIMRQRLVEFPLLVKHICQETWDSAIIPRIDRIAAKASRR